MNKREIAKETKKLANNENARLQVTKRLHGLGYNTYLTYGNDYFKEDEDERTLGFIDHPMSIAQVLEWLSDRQYIEDQIRQARQAAAGIEKPKIKGQHGGARPGGGRKPLPAKERRLQRNFYLNEEDFKKVKKYIDQLHAEKA